MSKKKRKSDPIILLLNAIIIILVIVMLIVGIFFIEAKKRSKELYSFTADSGMLAFLLEKGDYGGFIQGIHVDELNGIKVAEGYCALSDYIEATSMYKVYVYKKYDRKAHEQKTIMDNARGQMGGLTVYADRIDEMFGIEQ